MKQIVVTIFAASLLLGCQNRTWVGQAGSSCNSKATCGSQLDHLNAQTQQGDIQSQAATMSQLQSLPMLAVPYQNSSSLNANKQLSDYAGQIAMQLVETLHAFPPGANIAIASFVELDAELETSGIIGNQLAESFMYQLQQYGLAVVDFKTTRDIKVTARGDFVFSRKLQRLDKQQRIDYVLSGTMLHTTKGVVVNARVINVKSKVVAASAQQLIPHFVISSLYPAIHHG